MASDAWSGNIGEWGEAFVLLHLLAHNRLYNADSHGKRISNEFGDVEAIYRTENSGLNIELIVANEVIVVKHDGAVVVEIPKDEFARTAHSLFVAMQDQGTTAKHPEQAFLQDLGCESLKASSLMKADLRARIYDGFLSSRVTKDYSIKTVVGGDPSLANASDHSYIDYELLEFDEEKANIVNAIDGRSWVVNRTKKVLELCPNPVPIVRSPIFERNLRKCHWRAPEIIGVALMYGQTHRGKPVIESIADLKEINPLGFSEDELDDYEDAVRRYLWGVVFDLDPGQPWRGPSQVDGYLLVTEQEEVLAYQVSRQRAFEDYLLMHSRWDTPSTTRYRDVGRVWQREDGTWMYSLSSVVRYSVREYVGERAHLAGI
jgi:hypothetical protein